MKTCHCGGKLHRHGKNESGRQFGSQRYRCSVCGTSITVRDGKIVNPHDRKNIKDWRYNAKSEGPRGSLRGPSSTDGL